MGAGILDPMPYVRSQRWLYLIALSALLASHAAPAGAQPGAAIALSPYKDVSLGIDPAHPLIATAVHGGAAVPLPGGPGWPSGLQALTWAFATGECGDERWGPFDTAAFARLNVAAFADAKVGYTIATGGEAGIFTCASAPGMARFMARYESPLLQGFDFDIEGAQTDAQIASLMQQIRGAQLRRPGLQWRFTLATHAANDGSQQSLNRTGERVLAALAAAGVQAPVINLMVMNYGPAAARHCVRRGDDCDMAASALQAARNVRQRYGLPMSRIALTPMLGINDVARNIFTLEDARQMVDAARQAGLAGLHFWSLDRDRSCADNAAGLSPLCHGLPGLPALQFSQALQQALQPPAAARP